ncbi:MAG: ABC transporter ATP-binding protein [Rhodospirillales bacterium]|nr:ABC transporter ATP-binding protein [Rhodospirillales bacterium]MCB9980543.1 ABC transporter ATP-binding protein [Rhodospirillales bacterium]
MLKIDHLQISYGRALTLQDICLQIAYGETFGLIGLNGAGKTTLIKTILGLRAPQSGSVTFYTQEETALSQEHAKEAIAYLPERFEPPRFLLGEEFIRFSASLYKRHPSSEDIRQAAERLELDPGVLSRSVNTYSKGMRQKLGLIATILTGCSFLILDEPMSGLDPQARVCVKDTILSLKQEGRTIFLSSHILSDLHEICDHVAVLHQKTIQFDGVPDDLMKKYQSSSLERAFLEVIKNEKLAA